MVLETLFNSVVFQEITVMRYAESQIKLAESQTILNLINEKHEK